MGRIVMNENIDLTKILYGCPKGTIFYSPLFGHLIFCEIRRNILFMNESDVIVAFYPNGTYYSSYKNAECMVFPSKEQRDWDKFERFWDKPKMKRFDPKTFQPFDRVLVRDNDDDKWDCDFFSHYDEDQSYPYICISRLWSQCVPYNGETKHLVGTTDDCPEYYKWWEE